MIRGFIIFTLLGGALAASSANQYMDNLIQSGLPYELHASGLDPAHLPSFEVPFGYQDVYQQMAQASFIGGNATGLGKIRRGGDCLGPRFVRGELTINCTLKIFPILTNYAVTIKDDNRVHKVRNMGHVEETLLYVSIAGYQNQNFVGSIKQFQVQKMGLITPTFAGLPQQYFKYVKVLQDAYKANVSSYIFNVLQQNFRTAFSRAVASKPLPRQ